MKKQILIFTLLASIIFISCKKHKEERTEYLTQDQKDIINAFKVGDTFTMQKTEIDDGITFIDTITFKVSRAGYRVASNGRWYENGGPETWTETGVVEFKSVNRVLWESGSVEVEGGNNNTANIFFEDINPGGDIYFGNNNLILLHSNSTNGEINDSAYISLNKGIIKVWNSDVTYKRID